MFKFFKVLIVCIFLFLIFFSFLFSKSFSVFRDYDGEILANGEKVIVKNKGECISFFGNVDIRDDKNSLLLSDKLLIKNKNNKKYIDVFNLKKAKREFLEFDKQKLQDVLVIDSLSAKKCFLIYDVIKKNFDYAKLEGNVIICRERKKLEKYKIVAKSLLYDINKNKAFIDGISLISFFDEDKNEYVISCDKIIWNIKEDIFKIYGNPVIYKKIDDSYVVKSKFLTFIRKDKLFMFTEKPVLFQKDSQGKGEYVADTIMYNLNTKILDFSENVNIEYVPIKK